MTGKRILVFTASHLCRNPRVVKEARTLAGAGFDVTVLAVSNHPEFEQIDRALLAGQPFRRIVVDQLPGQLPGILRRGRTWAARWLVRVAGLETAAALGPAGALLRRARSLPADLTIAHTEIPLWAARALIAGGRRVAVDLEDWYSEDLLPADRRGRPLELLRRAEAFALREAAYVSTTSAAMADALASVHGGRRPVVLRNTFPLQPDPRPTRHPFGLPPAIVWFSQTIGPGRGLETFLAAWSQVPQRSRVVLIGAIQPGYRAALLDLVPAAQRPLVEFMPPVQPHDLPGRLSVCDIGLALEPRTPRNKDLTISNKILQYLNAGLAVVATATAGQSEVLRAAPDAGVMVEPDDVSQLGARLGELLTDPTRLAARQTAARAAAEREFCWEVDSLRLLAGVNAAVASSPPLHP